MAKKLLLIGGGGHCRSVLDCVLDSNLFDEIGIVERSRDACPILGIPVVGVDEDLPSLLENGWNNAFITVGSIGNTFLRRKLYIYVYALGFSIPNILDASAVVGNDVVLGHGNFIGKGAVINSGTIIGNATIINTGAILEHDCRIGDFAHISPGTVLCGDVSVAEDSHIGAGSVVIQQLKIGRNTIIGAGSVVVNNIPDECKAYGNPCKVVNK